MRKTLSAVTLAIVLPATLAAQSLREQTRGDTAGTPTRVISVNPFLPLWGNFQGEFERRLSANLAFAISGSHIDIFDERSTNLDVKLRLYPQSRALQGLGVAATVGVANISSERGQDCSLSGACTTRPRQNAGAPTFAVEGQYQWLLGTRRATSVSTGFGFKRYFADRKKVDITVRPTVKLNIGYAF
jgi:hypothetical protein